MLYLSQCCPLEASLLKLSHDAADKKIKIGQAPILAPVFFREAM